MWKKFCEEKGINADTPYEAWSFGEYGSCGLIFDKNSFRILSDEFQVVYS